MTTRALTLLICVEVVPSSLLLLGFWAWLRWRERSGLAKRTASGQQAAHMPVDFLKPERRKLSELAPGATAFIDFTDVSVDLSGKTYVELDARVYEESHMHTVIVREMDGGYILLIPKGRRDGRMFTPRRLYTSIAHAPVIQIIEDESDWLSD
jgi:hypothetical protein